MPIKLKLGYFFLELAHFMQHDATQSTPIAIHVIPLIKNSKLFTKTVENTDKNRLKHGIFFLPILELCSAEEMMTNL